MCCLTNWYRNVHTSGSYVRHVHTQNSVGVARWFWRKRNSHADGSCLRHIRIQNNVHLARMFSTNRNFHAHMHGLAWAIVIQQWSWFYEVSLICTKIGCIFMWLHTYICMQCNLLHISLQHYIWQLYVMELAHLSFMPHVWHLLEICISAAKYSSHHNWCLYADITYFHHN